MTGRLEAAFASSVLAQVTSDRCYGGNSGYRFLRGRPSSAVFGACQQGLCRLPLLHGDQPTVLNSPLACGRMVGRAKLPSFGVHSWRHRGVDWRPIMREHPLRSPACRNGESPPTPTSKSANRALLKNRDTSRKARPAVQPRPALGQHQQAPRRRQVERLGPQSPLRPCRRLGGKPTWRAPPRPLVSSQGLLRASSGRRAPALLDGVGRRAIGHSHCQAKDALC